MIRVREAPRQDSLPAVRVQKNDECLMIETYKQVVAHQFEAAFCTLGLCVDRCPDSNWDAPVAKLRFCQVAFHALIFSDLYLGRDVPSLRRQLFHRENASIFADYEELEDRIPQQVYDKSFIKAYLLHCRDKASRVVAAETVETLNMSPAVDRRHHSRAELHFTNIRHINHHAAQLSLRLRLDTNEDIPWIHSGWRDV